MDPVLLICIGIAAYVTFRIAANVTRPPAPRIHGAPSPVCSASRPRLTGWGNELHGWSEDPPAYGANRADPTVWKDREYNRQQEQRELERLTKAWPGNRWQHVRQREHDLDEYERFAGQVTERTHERERERR